MPECSGSDCQGPYNQRKAKRIRERPWWEPAESIDLLLSLPPLFPSFLPSFLPSPLSLSFFPLPTLFLLLLGGCMYVRVWARSLTRHPQEPSQPTDSQLLRLVMSSDPVQSYRSRNKVLWLTLIGLRGGRSTYSLSTYPPSLSLSFSPSFSSLISLLALLTYPQSIPFSLPYSYGVYCLLLLPSVNLSRFTSSLSPSFSVSIFFFSPVSVVSLSPYIFVYLVLTAKQPTLRLAPMNQSTPITKSRLNPVGEE